MDDLKKIAQLEADLEEMKKDQDVEMIRLTAKMVKIQAKLKIVKLEADLVDGRERNRELERKIAEAKRSDQNLEVREGKANNIGDLEGKINALQSKISGLETQINRTRTCLELDTGWSYLAKTASWYKVINQEMTIDEAEAYCASRKIHLVSIRSQEEQDFVWELAKTVQSLLGWGFWIGLKRNPNKGNAFEWTDGSSVGFTNWMVGEPDSNTHAAGNPNKGNAFESTDESSIDFGKGWISVSLEYRHAYLRGDDGKWQFIRSFDKDLQRCFICKMSSQFS